MSLTCAFQIGRAIASDQHHTLFSGERVKLKRTCYDLAFSASDIYVGNTLLRALYEPRKVMCVCVCVCVRACVRARARACVRVRVCVCVCVQGTSLGLFSTLNSLLMQTSLYSVVAGGGRSWRERERERERQRERERERERESSVTQAKAFDLTMDREVEHTPVTHTRILAPARGQSVTSPGYFYSVPFKDS